MTPRFDLRHERVAKRPKIKVMRDGGPVIRDPADVTTVVLHQTAVPFGVAPYQIKAAGGDPALALARRGLNVACHAIAFRAGFYACVAPLRWYVQHGNKYNARSLGLEVDGRYAGIEGDPRTVWGGEPTELTTATIDAARCALRWLVETGRAEGMPITQIRAHRQSSATRRSDPGQALWMHVALWGRDELGLETACAEVLGDGRPVPVAWDPDGVGRY